ncbi:MAG: hypothetical protein ACI3VA_03080 [Candidatus Limivicinus sp.]
MNHNLSRTLIETIVRKTISDIRESPRRSTRNLVDLALNFADGRFQSQFFASAQAMLQNDDSAYYSLIPDVVATTDPDKLVTFGLNIGYNSCTLGARKIRALEQQEQYSIPWSITLAVSGAEYPRKREAYRDLLRQGQALGIYTWMLHTLDNPGPFLALAAENPDCAFVVYCTPEEITDSLLDEAEGLQNLLFAVLHYEGAEGACRKLRSRRFLYAVWYTYDASDLDSILNGAFFRDPEQLHPAMTGFLAEPGCPEEVRQTVYQYLVKTRNSQQYPTVPWDIENDRRFVDSIISEDSCSAGFDPEGYLCTSQGRVEGASCNIFRQPLSAILKQAFPKTPRSA